MTTGKDILFAALQDQETTRPAWVPFVGSHGASLIGVSAKEYLQNTDLLVQGLLKANELYKPDGLPIIFDLQMEAEVLGCDLDWSQDGPPAVTSHPLSMAEGNSLDDLPEFDVTKGRFPIALDATRRVKREIGENIGLYGLLCGPFTLCLHLFGNDIFLKMFDDADGVKKVLSFASDVAKRIAEAYLDAGCDVIAVVDPMTSQISPDHFSEFVEPHVNDVFDHVREKAGFSSLFVCGDASRNLEQMCQTRCDNLSIDENISLEYLQDLAEKHDKSVGGNLKLTVVLLMGTPDDARLDAIRCIDACERKGFILAPGCDLPFATPPENLQAVAEMVRDEYKRDVARRTLKAASKQDNFDDIEIPDYANSDKVIVDCVTLDSLTCAPCQYMVDAAQKAAGKLGDDVICAEHKINTREGLAYMTKLGVQNIPSICINGEVAFASIIPDQDTLVDAIREKMKTRA